MSTAWGSPPFALPVHAAADGDFFSIDPDEPTNLEFLRIRVGQGWVIITVMFVPRRPAHAVVLIGLAAGTFHYLDPAEPRENQPHALSETRLVKVWTGQMLVARTA